MFRCRLAPFRSITSSIHPFLHFYVPSIQPFTYHRQRAAFVPGEATLFSADPRHMELHCMAKQVLIIAFCLLLLASSSQARWGARSGGEKNSDDVVHEVTVATFNSTLAAAPATWAMVEFYAHWYLHDAGLRLPFLLCSTLSFGFKFQYFTRFLSACLRLWA